MRNKKPDDNHINILSQALFNNPTTVLCSLLGLQLVLVSSQLLCLLHLTEWYQILSMMLLLVINYYSLFKVTRDYMICFKVYRTEQIAHEKSQMVVQPVAQ